MPVTTLMPREFHLRYELGRAAAIAKGTNDPTNAKFWARVAVQYARTLAEEGWESNHAMEVQHLPDYHETEDEWAGDAEPHCTNPGGHKFECTGTRYGGDDTRWNGEGRCLCVYCGADGDA